MKNPCVWLAIALLMISCAKRPVRSSMQTLQIEDGKIVNFSSYLFEGGKFVGETAYYARFYPDGTLMRMGQFALNSEGQMSRYQTGICATYYKNGQVREIGEYGFGGYSYCGTIPIDKFYPYKTGYWRYYYENGVPAASGVYQMESINIPNMCHGGADLTFGFVTDEWEFYDSIGTAIKPNREQKKEIERVGINPEFGKIYWIPDREKGTVKQEYIPE